MEEAENMFTDLLGCMTLRYTSSTLGELCQEHVDKVSFASVVMEGPSSLGVRFFIYAYVRV